MLGEFVVPGDEILKYCAIANCRIEVWQTTNGSQLISQGSILPYLLPKLQEELDREDTVVRYRP